MIDFTPDNLREFAQSADFFANRTDDVDGIAFMGCRDGLRNAADQLEQIGLRNIIHQLIEMQRQFDEWSARMNAIENVQIDHPISVNCSPLDLALDILGVPKDNTIEMKACEIAWLTGMQPDGVFCRDWHYDTFITLVCEDGNIDGYIDAIQESLKGNDAD